MKKKVKKIILLTLLILLLLLVIVFTYKLVWYRKVINAGKIIRTADNYLYEFIQYAKMTNPVTNEESDNIHRTQYLVKDDVRVVKNYVSNDIDNLEYKYFLYEKEGVLINEKDKTFSIQSEPYIQYQKGVMVNYMMPEFWNDELSFFENLKYFLVYKYWDRIMGTNIEFANIDGRDTIIFREKYCNIYFDAETLIAYKVTDAESGEENLIYEYRLELDVVTDEDITIPELNQYKQIVY